MGMIGDLMKLAAVGIILWKSGIGPMLIKFSKNMLMQIKTTFTEHVVPWLRDKMAQLGSFAQDKTVKFKGFAAEMIAPFNNFVANFIDKLNKWWNGTIFGNGKVGNMDAAKASSKSSFMPTIGTGADGKVFITNDQGQVIMAGADNVESQRKLLESRGIKINDMRINETAQSKDTSVAGVASSIADSAVSTWNWGMDKVSSWFESDSAPAAGSIRPSPAKRTSAGQSMPTRPAKPAAPPSSIPNRASISVNNLLSGQAVRTAE
jgi:ribosome-associated protein YbcJ (S4-like RNA binding protein)